MISNYYRGGLGNQLFQVSTGIALANKCDNKYIIDVNNNRGLGQGSAIDNYKNSIFKNVEWGKVSGITKIVTEKFHIYTELDCASYDNIILDGFFQSEKYFENHQSTLTDLYGFDSANHGYGIIHIRTGDYAMHYNNNFNVITKEYISNSIKISEYMDKWFVVGDELSKCEAFLPNDIKYELVVANEIDALKLMSHSSTIITSNSTFSWWGAYLGNPDKKVYVPYKWTVDDTCKYIFRDNMKKIWF